MRHRLSKMEMESQKIICLHHRPLFKLPKHLMFQCLGLAQAYSDGKINHNRVNTVMLAGDYAYWIQKELKRKLDAGVFTCESDNGIVKGAVVYGEKLKNRIEKLDRIMNGVAVDIKL